MMAQSVGVPRTENMRSLSLRQRNGSCSVSEWAVPD